MPGYFIPLFGDLMKRQAQTDRRLISDCPGGTVRGSHGSSHMRFTVYTRRVTRIDPIIPRKKAGKYIQISRFCADCRERDGSGQATTGHGGNIPLQKASRAGLCRHTAPYSGVPARNYSLPNCIFFCIIRLYIRVLRFYSSIRPSNNAASRGLTLKVQAPPKRRPS